MKISVIIPVFNAAGTLEGTLQSVAAQTFRDFEVVFVDDCSTDSSPAIIEGFASESGMACKVVRQEKNGGVALARNRGLEEATGEYVTFVDADDSIEPDALEIAVKAVQDTDADIAGWDWKLGFEKNGRYMRQADYDTPLQALKNLMGGTMRWNLWLFLLKRNLIVSNGISFIDGANMGEDMMFMTKCFLKAGKTVQVHASLYNYNAVNPGSISKQLSEVRRAEVSRNVEEVISAVEASAYSKELQEYIPALKLYIKLPLLVSPDRKDYMIWHSWFPESNPFAMANKALPLRTRVLQWMAANKFWSGVKLYYIFVYRFVYGIIYR